MPSNCRGSVLFSSSCIRNAFERIETHTVDRYEAPESEIVTPLRRSDWAVPHGSAMQALGAALEAAAAAGGTMVRHKARILSFGR